MYKYPALLLLLVAVTACGRPGQEISNAAAEGARFGPAAESVVRNAVSINPCPTGFRAVGVDVTTGSSAIIIDRNGAVDTTLAADGKRTQRCIPVTYQQ